MELKEIEINEFGRFDWGSGLLEGPCECGIEPPVSISHYVSICFVIYMRKVTMNIDVYYKIVGIVLWIESF